MFLKFIYIVSSTLIFSIVVSSNVYSVPNSALYNASHFPVLFHLHKTSLQTHCLYIFYLLSPFSHLLHFVFFILFVLYITYFLWFRQVFFITFSITFSHNLSHDFLQFSYFFKIWLASVFSFFPNSWWRIKSRLISSHYKS